MQATTPTILITGASDGIGRALAERYHAKGAHLILIGRRSPAMLDPALITAHHYCQLDLTSSGACAALSQFLADRSIAQIDLLILNAGIGSYGPIAEQSAGSIAALLDTNLIAPMELTHALLPYLPRPHGQVVLIGSVAANLPAPEYAVYAASKAALAGFARSLRIELAGQILVQIIHPGAVRTGMHAKIGMPLERIGWQRFPPPERIAAELMTAIASQQPVVTIGWGNRLLRWLSRTAGGVIDWAIEQRQR
jgi:short-subunit dehydrogenase